MRPSTRRTFLQQTGLTAGAALAWAGASSGAVGANERVNLGVIGLSRGRAHCEAFAAAEDARVVYVCDTDRQRLESIKGRYNVEKGVTDLREILDDKSIDAVAIATPDHWHAPAAILACEAGKHVYVEKPCSHNIREGRLMIEAARRHERVMQVGTQNRSNEGVREVVQMLREGAIGDVLAVKVINSQLRANIGHQQPSDPPEHVDYDQWVGPAPMVPYQANRLHYGWHWWYAFGTGDIGNDGVHDLDIGLWGLGVEGHPSRISGYGSKMFFDDDQQFPDTYSMTYEYPGGGAVGQKRLLVFEQRIWSPYREQGFENGDIYYGTKGMLHVGKGDGYRLYAERNKLVKEKQFGMPLTEHQRNFLDAIHGTAKPNADIDVGHLSATLAHLGNICARLGRSLTFDPKTEQFPGDDEANQLTRREYREGHWAVPKRV
ncbi:MAG: Gfo/Idh/MocA family oxidoreductase [Planctomycetota bacterium]